MSQRNSGYARKERDLYETPEWVTESVLPHLPDYIDCIWEPACGSGKMVRAIANACPSVEVVGSDIEPAEGFNQADFLGPIPRVSVNNIGAIVTNPPYELAQDFIEMALLRMQPSGVVAMLLRTDYDHAKSRRHLFADNPAFCKKLVLTKRIVWFEGGKSPSFNHAWFLWDWQHEGPPTIAYGP